MKKQPTIADIARKTGVAPMTVSRAINGGYISEEMRARVMAAVRELDYHPNAVARSLKRRRTHVVGVLLPDISNPFSSELARAIEETLQPAGYSCFISTTQRSAAREEAALSAFYDHRADGVLVATRETRAGNKALEKLADRGLPTVLVGRNFMSSKVDRVTADHWTGGSDLTVHLIEQGHRRIAFVGASLMNGSGLQRFQGYLTAMREHGLAVPPDYLVANQDADSPGFSTQADGYEGLKQLMALSAPPTAVFARNDYTAIGAMCAVHDLGMRVPDDIAIAGFDNISISAYTTPPLTTVEQCMSEQGHRAADLLLDRMENRHNGPRREFSFACKLIVRQSTAGAPALSKAGSPASTVQAARL